MSKVNRKLIVNEKLAWPSVHDSTNKIIIQALENNLSKYPSIKRAKTLPKYLREKLKNKNDENASLSKEQQRDKDFAKLLKLHMRLGINSVTKSLESEPENMIVVLVCKSCVPVTVLTQHLKIMCSNLSIPAACVQNLSTTMSKLLNIKSVSALGLCRDIKGASDDHTLLQDAADLIKTISDGIVPNLPPLSNSFGSLDSENISIIDYKIAEMLETKIDLESETDSKIEESENNEENEDEMEVEDYFGADFIDVENNSKSNIVDFHSNKFILFDDGYDNEKEVEAEENKRKAEQFRNQSLNMGRNSNNKMTYINMNHLSLVQKPAGKKKDKKKKLMNSMERTNFKKDVVKISKKNKLIKLNFSSLIKSLIRFFKS